MFLLKVFFVSTTMTPSKISEYQRYISKTWAFRYERNNKI